MVMLYYESYKFQKRIEEGVENHTRIVLYSHIYHLLS